MDFNAQLNVQTDCSQEITHVGRQVIAASLLMLLMTLLAFAQVGNLPMGEIGHFIHDAALFIIPLSVWGVATGVGLMRAWRWGRISMLVFGGLLALSCSVPAVGFWLVPGRGIES